MNSHDLFVLQLEPHDDVVSVRDRLTFSDAPRVVLVWPDKAPVLRRKLDLLLIQRHATRQALRLAIVTDDQTIIDHAGDLNISVFASVEAAHHTRAWKQPHNRVFAERPDPYSQAALAEHLSRLRGGEAVLTAAAWRRHQIIRWGLFLGMIGLLGLFFLFLAPSARVTITPASDQIFVRVPITADPALTDIDVENYRMPAAVVSLEASSRVTVQSSGRETTGLAQAQGLVSFTNNTDQPLVILLGTIVGTGGTYPVRFQTMIEVTLPAGPGTTVQAPIQALPEHAGDVGNVDPGAITRVEGLGDLVSVTNPNATFGGATQERATVTAEDHERLLVLGRQQVLQRARDLLLHELTGEQFLVPGSLRIIAESPEWLIYSAFVGDVAESVSLDMKAQVQAVVVDGEQARQVAYAGLAPYIEPGREVSQEALDFSRGDIEQVDPNGRVTFLMIVKGNIAVSIEESAVRGHINGKTIQEARQVLERRWLLDPDQPPEITIWPNWFGHLPLLPWRINVEVKAP